MPGEKSTNAEKPEIKISIQGNVTGNLVVGDGNTVSQPAAHPQKSFRRRLVLTILVLIALAVVTFSAWKIFSSTLQITPEPGADLPHRIPLVPGVWQIEIFDNPNLNGSPWQVLTQPAVVNTEGGYQISLTPQSLGQHIIGMPANNYSLRLAGEFEFQTGYFEFHCEHHDGCRVFVDGRNWIDAWWDGGGGHDLARDLSAGKHLVVIEFYDKSGYGLLEMRWRIKP